LRRDLNAGENSQIVEAPLRLKDLAFGERLARFDGDLAFDHAEIIGMAVKRLRGKLDAAGVGYQEESGSSLYFSDPDGARIELIADKLGISRSAAKERAERLYKRLGVHSRDEAVDRARELGLLRR